MGAAPPQPERRELSGAGDRGRRAPARFPERRLLQAVVAVGCLIPLAAGSVGIVRGAALLKGVHDSLPIDLESHFRYLSGLLLGIGIGFAACIPGIERRGPLMRTLGLIVVVGGLGRLSSLLRDGPPSAAHVAALGMELVATPILLLWQARVARLAARNSLQTDRRAAGPAPGDPPVHGQRPDGSSPGMPEKLGLDLPNEQNRPLC